MGFSLPKRTYNGREKEKRNYTGRKKGKMKKSLIFLILGVFLISFVSSVLLADFTETFTGTTIDSSRWNVDNNTGVWNISQNNKLIINGTATVDPAPDASVSGTVNAKSTFGYANLSKSLNILVDTNLTNTTSTLAGTEFINAAVYFNNGILSLECTLSANATGYYLVITNSSEDVSSTSSSPFYSGDGTLNLFWNITSNNFTCSFLGVQLSITEGSSIVINESVELRMQGSVDYNLDNNNYLYLTFDNLVYDVQDYVKPSFISFVAPGITTWTNRSINNIPINISAIDDYLINNILIRLYNSTNNLINSSLSNLNVLSGSYFFNFTSLSDGIYYVNATVNDTSNNVNDSSTLTITIDTTSPSIYATNISSPISFGNYTGLNKVFNVSIVDTLLEVETVFFNITNSSGGQNATYTATREGSTSRYSVLFNTTNFIDGSYNVTVWANDSLNNLNNSARLQFTVDNIYPLVSYGTGTSVAFANLSQTSIYVNVSITETNFANVTYVLYNATSQLNLTTFTTATYTINWTSLPNGIYKYEVNVTDSVNNKNSTGLRNITLDTVSPSVYATNFSFPVSYGNYSGLNNVINISVIDALSGIETVFFNITNSSGVQNATYTSSREGSTLRYSVLFNTTSFPDGAYNITAYVIDLAGNLNNSAKVQFNIDNTAPALSLSSSSTTTTSITVTKTCTDSLSGVLTCVITSSAGTVLGSEISGLSCGTAYTITLTGTDNSGNSALTSSSISTSACAVHSGGSSGSTTLTWINNYLITDTQFTTGYTKELSAKNRIKFKLGTVDHSVGVLSLNTTSVRIEVASIPINATLNIGDIKKFDLNADGYYDVSVKLISIANSRANIEVKKINELVSTTVAEDNLDTGEGAGEGEGGDNPPETGEETDTSSDLYIKILRIILVIIIIIMVIVIFFIRRKNKKNKNYGFG